MGAIRVMLVDDHQMFREGLKFVISKIPNMEVVGEASNGQEFLDQLAVAQPDVTLMDIGMPVMDGITATQQATEQQPDLKVIALSMFNDQEYYQRAVDAGVSGFLIKEAGIDELEKAIKAVHHGNQYFSQELLQYIIQALSNPKVVSSKTTPIQLTRREEEILELICKGLDNKEIADKLFISQKTVEGHKTNLLSKTHSKNTINLMLFALKHKLVELS